MADCSCGCSIITVQANTENDGCAVRSFGGIHVNEKLNHMRQKLLNFQKATWLRVCAPSSRAFYRAFDIPYVLFTCLLKRPADNPVYSIHILWLFPGWSLIKMAFVLKESHHWWVTGLNHVRNTQPLFQLSTTANMLQHVQPFKSWVYNIFLNWRVFLSLSDQWRAETWAVQQQQWWILLGTCYWDAAQH